MATMERTRTPGIYKRGSRYVVVWRHRGKQHKSFHPTYEEAREAKGQRQAGDKRPVSRVRLGDYFEQWIKTYAGRTSRGFSETSREEYRRVMETYVLPKWKTWKLAEVEPADLRVRLASMRESGLLASNPCHGVRIPAAAEGPADKQAKALTREELGLLLAALPERWRLFFELLTHSGLRISEMVGLTWQHVDLGERPHIKVREQVYRGKRRRLKSGKGLRDVPLSSAIAKRLLKHRRDTFAGPEAPVFPSATGGPLPPPNVGRNALHPAREAIGMEWVTFHTFRHTCASLLFEAGRNIRQVAEWLGHTDPSFTLRTYVHLMDGGLGDADFLDRAVRPAGKVGNALGNLGATRDPETAANPVAVDSAQTVS